MSSYLKWLIDEAIRVKCPMGRRIKTLLAGPPPSDDHIRSAVDHPSSTRRVTYKDLNPALSRYFMYDFVMMLLVVNKKLLSYYYGTKCLNISRLKARQCLLIAPNN